MDLSEAKADEGPDEEEEYLEEDDIEADDYNNNNIDTINEAFLKIITKTEKGNVLQDIALKEPTIKAFREFIQTKVNILRENNLLSNKVRPFQYCGGIILQELIVKKLTEISTKAFKITEDKKLDRLSYFKSDHFINHFMDKLEPRDKATKSIQDSSYTNWLNTVFHVTYKDWRINKLSKIKDQEQCRRALKYKYKSDDTPSVIQQKGDTSCYLCGNMITKDQASMECEHVLGIITALSHWWLIKDLRKEYTKPELKDLELEYAWSHRCCNQLKSNYDFIKYSFDKVTKTPRYIVDEKMIQNVLTSINMERQKSEADSKYDCIQIGGMVKVAQSKSIVERMEGMVNKINMNVNQFDTIDEYTLFTKYKIVSALSDESFLQVLVGDGKIIAIKKTKEEIEKEEYERMIQDKMDRRNKANAARDIRVIERKKEEDIMIQERNSNIVMDNTDVPVDQVAPLKSFGLRYKKDIMIEDQMSDTEPVAPYWLIPISILQYFSVNVKEKDIWKKELLEADKQFEKLLHKDPIEFDYDIGMYNGQDKSKTINRQCRKLKVELEKGIEDYYDKSDFHQAFNEAFKTKVGFTPKPKIVKNSITITLSADQVRELLLFDKLLQMYKKNVASSRALNKKKYNLSRTNKTKHLKELRRSKIRRHSKGLNNYGVKQSRHKYHRTSRKQSRKQSRTKRASHRK